MQYLQRQQHVRRWLEESSLDAFLVTSAANVRYLSGFGGEGYLVLSGQGAALCTDSRYTLEAEQLDVEDLGVIINSNGYVDGALQWLGDQNASRLAFEEHQVTYAQYAKLRQLLTAANLEPVSGVVEKLRIVKEDSEVALVRSAAAIVSQAVAELFADLEPGLTEREIAMELDQRMVRGGAEGPAFPTIAASGPNSALPHARPGKRRLSSGEMLKIDAGCWVDGYCSDMTRTIWVGDDPTEQFRTVYSAVLAAQEAALATVKAGVACAEVDRTARRVLTEAGFGDNFTHGLGHGVGLEVHEGPRLSSRSDQWLQSGMLVTVEPGAYISGWGGVRIEDLVLVTDDGCEILTDAPRVRY
jgi:Xaa-Pro aminopeptidase